MWRGRESKCKPRAGSDSCFDGNKSRVSLLKISVGRRTIFSLCRFRYSVLKRGTNCFPVAVVKDGIAFSVNHRDLDFFCIVNASRASRKLKETIQSCSVERWCSRGSPRRTMIKVDTG